jgi:hypothetical protein
MSGVMKTDQTASLRKHLVELLDGGQAHATFDDVIKGLPPQLRGTRPKGASHSPWELLEHMRIAQRDILEFTRNARHESPKWPEGYWPDSPKPASPKAWAKTVAAVRADLQAVKDIATDKSIDLFAKIPHGDGQTVLREILLVADHNAYHIGQLATVRKLLGAWA